MRSARPSWTATLPVAAPRATSSPAAPRGIRWHRTARPATARWPIRPCRPTCTCRATTPTPTPPRPTAPTSVARCSRCRPVSWPSRPVTSTAKKAASTTRMRCCSRA
ncbi:hypothetical protein G6F24_017161 [Rhizopus arrhizus]|nr:hypothetical protein G6F24_017161 [Rhizopus arrhizus]